MAVIGKTRPEAAAMCTLGACVLGEERRSEPMMSMEPPTRGPAVYNAGGHTKKPSTVPVCVEKFTPILYKGRGSAAYSLA